MDGVRDKWEWQLSESGTLPGERKRFEAELQRLGMSESDAAASAKCGYPFSMIDLPVFA
jgi:hypothetical protein